MINPLLVFVIFCSGWGLLYLLYRYIGNHWYDMMDTTRSLITLVCFSTFAGAGWVVWLMRDVFVVLLTIILVVVGVIAFFAGGGGAYLPGGPKDREMERDANLRGISNALDDIKKKL